MSSGELQTAIDLGREALTVAVKITFPVLAAGLVVGMLISVLQAATQVQEQTLSIVPKMFAIVVVLFLAMPWLLTVLVEYTHGLVSGMDSLWR